RGEHLQSADPVRVMLGDIASQAAVRRLEVPLLSAEAVAALAGGTSIDPVALHRETGGNAFFVTEVLAAGGRQLPSTVQGAVRARLRTIPMSPRPYARLAEHAVAAGDPLAILEFAVAAGKAAASLGSHREAAYQYGRALPYAELLDEGARIHLLLCRAKECQV